MLLADQKPSSPNGDTTRAVLRMARLYYDRCPKVLDWSNLHGKTALHFAAQKGNEELVRVGQFPISHTSIVHMRDPLDAMRPRCGF